MARAIILAAGVGKRIAPLSYELPKALLKVRGEVLIERLIRQMHQAGIDDITVVVGYLKESLFYLEDEFGVTIRVNPDYADRHNHSSLYVARDKLPGALVCSSDQYFERNLFLNEPAGSYLTVVPSPGGRVSWAVDVDDQGTVTTVKARGEAPYAMLGPAYFSSEAGEAFARLIEVEMDKPTSAGKLWDDVLAEHLEELPRFGARVIDASTVSEFKRFDDLLEFDQAFIDNVDSRIFDNICLVLKCGRHDVTNVVPISQGLTNLSFRFDCMGRTYVYRHPGRGTDEIINRSAETFSLSVARDLGLDATFVYEDPKAGWKLSRYVDGCVPFDYGNREHVAKAFALARTLHQSGVTSRWSFDFWQEAEHIEGLLRGMSYPLPKDFPGLAARVAHLARLMRKDVGEPVLCHNDFYGPNFLVKGDDMWLIDWEYSAMGDYACDIGNFVAQGSGYTVEEALDVLDLYYGREPTKQERRHCLAAIAVVGWYWYVWAMYKAAQGNPVGEWLYIWYRAARDYCKAALPLYGEE